MDEERASTYIPLRILGFTSKLPLVSWQVVGPPILYEESCLPVRPGAWPWIYLPSSSNTLMISIILSSALNTPIKSITSARPITFERLSIFLMSSAINTAPAFSRPGTAGTQEGISMYIFIGRPSVCAFIYSTALMP